MYSEIQSYRAIEVISTEVETTQVQKDIELREL